MAKEDTRDVGEYLRDIADLERPIGPEERKEVVAFRSWLLSQREKLADKGEHELIADTITITPAAAIYILEMLNKDNRHITVRHVDFFAGELERGGLQLSPQGISFSRCGLLNDGQHRLTACVKTGVPFRVLAVVGGKRELMRVLDSGRKRQGHDALSLIGTHYASTVAAAARLLIYLQDDVMGRKPAIPNDLLIERVLGNRGLEDAAIKAYPFSRKAGCVPSAAALSVFLISEKIGADNPDAAQRFDEFLDRLVSGGGERDYCLALRDGLQRRSFDRDMKDATNRAYAQAAAVIRAWNNHVKYQTKKRKNPTAACTIKPWKPDQKFPEVDVG